MRIHILSTKVRLYNLNLSISDIYSVRWWFTKLLFCQHAPCQPILTHKLPNKINHLNYHYFPALELGCRAVAVEITLVIGNESRLNNSSTSVGPCVRVAASLSILGVVFVINNKELFRGEELTGLANSRRITPTHSRTTLDVKAELIHRGSGDELTLAVHLPRDRWDRITGQWSVNSVIKPISSTGSKIDGDIFQVMMIRKWS